MNYYELLGLSSESTEKEVRKAYVMKIRQFPPEKYPEEFNQIRQAYETLGNEKSRQEYDTMSAHGEEINQYMTLGLDLVEEGHYEEAASNFKRILMIDPGLHRARNHFALCLSYQGEDDKALLQLDKLLEGDPSNSTYHSNRAYVLGQLERDEEAIQAFNKAFELDPNNVKIIFDLADLYQRLGRMLEAAAVIEKAISGCEPGDFHPFIYLFKLLKLEMMNKNEKGIENTFKRIEMILASNPDESEYVAGQYASFAYELYEYKLYQWAVLLTERAVQLHPDDEFIQQLHRETSSKKPAYEEYEKLKEDSAIHESIKHLFLLYLYGDEVTEEEFETYSDSMYDHLFQSSKYEFEAVMKSVKRILIQYPTLYENRKEVLQRCLEVCNEYKELDDQYNRMKNDAEVIPPIKRFVALWLAENLSDNERTEYFNDMMSELDEYPFDRVKRTSDYMRHHYPRCFELNSNFFEELIRLANQQQVERNNSANAQQSRPAASRPANNSSSSNSSSCFVATVAYGTPLTEELDVLRSWRDRVLKRHFLGNIFITYYYKFGPCMASTVNKSESAKKFVRHLLGYWVQRIQKKHRF